MGKYKYFKTTQPVPGKGEAYMYYECTPDLKIRRYLTYIPATGETKKVPDPFVKEVQNPALLMEATEVEFLRHWPEPFEDKQEALRQILEETYDKTSTEHFSIDMTIGEAMSVHPRVAEVFAAFHLGGCSGCAVSEVETVGQVCAGYGVDVDTLLEVLENLVEEETPA